MDNNKHKCQLKLGSQKTEGANTHEIIFNYFYLCNCFKCVVLKTE